MKNKRLKLKPCPLCSGDAKIETITYGSAKTVSKIFCIECGLIKYDMFGLVEKAIAFWNKRTVNRYKNLDKKYFDETDLDDPNYIIGIAVKRVSKNIPIPKALKSELKPTNKRNNKLCIN